VFQLLDVLVVCEGRHWSAVCTNPDCCPIGGRPIPLETTELEAAGRRGRPARRRCHARRCRGPPPATTRGSPLPWRSGCGPGREPAGAGPGVRQGHLCAWAVIRCGTRVLTGILDSQADGRSMPPSPAWRLSSGSPHGADNPAEPSTRALRGSSIRVGLSSVPGLRPPGRGPSSFPRRNPCGTASNAPPQRRPPAA
jgi:hypothetical protein